MGDHNPEFHVRLSYDDGWRTPAIEDDNHPLNRWRSQQLEGQGNEPESHFSAQDELAREQLDRLRKAQRSMLRRHSTSFRFHPVHDEHLPWRERVKHTSWAWFAMTMATGGLANVLHAVPFHSEWIHIVGLMFFFLNITLYIIIWSMLIVRFRTDPSSFRTSLTHPTESLFVPAFLVSFGTICITIVEYGADRAGEWLTDTVLVLFWINVSLAVSLSITIYMILWSSLTFTIAQMTPIWIFPAYPLLIVGPHAANLAAKLHSPDRILQVIVGGFTVQGIGFLVSLTIYSAFVYRLMTQKLPTDPSRPGMFVSVGPAAFTCSGTIGMAANLQRAIAGDDKTYADPNFMGVPRVLAAQILRLVGNWMCLWLWGLAIWFFFVSVISNVAPLFTLQAKEHQDSSPGTDQIRSRPDNTNTSVNHHGRVPRTLSLHNHRHLHHAKIPFAMTWYSYIFPQTALITATFRIADAFAIHELKILGCVMAGLLIAMWFFVMGMMIRAIILKQILWPEKGEDREEGGFVRPKAGGKGKAKAIAIDAGVAHPGVLPKRRGGGRREAEV